MNKKLLLFLCSLFFGCYSSEELCTKDFSCFDMVTLKNKRSKQEDTWAYALSSSFLKNGSFFAVFDGHEGAQVSKYLGKNLPKKFADYLNKPLLEKEAFEHSFDDCEKHAIKNFDSGSTALMIYINHNGTDCVAHVANVGDSRVVFGNSKTFLHTKDQTIDREDERERILKANGVVYKYSDAMNQLISPWRVNGLAMTRSIGDRWSKGKCERGSSKKLSTVKVFDKTCLCLEQWSKGKVLRDLSYTPQENQVIAVPEYTKEILTDKHRWLILATDGLWDDVSNEKALEIVELWYDKNKSLVGVAKELANTAISKGSEDNITVIVVDLLKLCKNNSVNK